MSQKIVFKLLKELGGEATTREVTELALERYPDIAYPKCISVKLSNLTKWGYLSWKKDTGNMKARRYKIIEELKDD